MKVMCFTEEEIADVLQVIAGVLQLGNVNFMAAGGAQVAEKSGLYLQFIDGVRQIFLVLSYSLWEARWPNG